MLKKLKNWWFGLWNKAELKYIELANRVEARIHQAERLALTLHKSWTVRMKDAEVELERLREEMRDLKGRMK